MIRVGSVRGVPIHAHWSLAVIVAWATFAAVTISPPMILVGCGFIVLMLIHELGHAEMARRCGYRSHRIELYPLIGFCYVDAPEYSREDCQIAWGGVLAQAPFLLVAALAQEFSHVLPWLGAVVFVFGPLNLALIVTNLIPVAPLDGAKAWRAYSARGR